MASSFKRSCAHMVTLSAPNPAAGHHQPTPPPETPGHSLASLGQSVLGSLLLSSGSCCIRFCCALQESTSQSCVSSGSSVVGLMVTSSKRAYAAPRSAAQSPCPCGRPLLTCSSAADTQMQFWLSLCGVPGSWCAQGMFEPSECLWWKWGLILNANSPLLLSCWGFSLALGREASFFGGIQRSPVDGCSAASCNLGIFKGGDDRTSSYSTILNSVQVYFANKLTYKNIHCSIYCRRL